MKEHGDRFNRTENAELRTKIDEAKRRLPLPELLTKLGLAEHAKKSAQCPFHQPDKHPSFSVFQGKDGFWRYKCFTCDQQGGDEITFLVKHLSLSRAEAICRFLELAGYPPYPAGGLPGYSANGFPESRELPEEPECLESPQSLGSLELLGSPECPVSLVSTGEGSDLEPEELTELAQSNVCNARNTAWRRVFKLDRDLRAVEQRINRQLEIDELLKVFEEWYQLSVSFLDPAKTRDYYLALFLAGLAQVRWPTGSGALSYALQAVSKLGVSDLPLIPKFPDAPKPWRVLAALHRVLSMLRGGKTYFLSYRDAGKAIGVCSTQAQTITRVLQKLGVIMITDKGQSGLNSEKATEFLYLLEQSQDDPY